ncbi:glycosyltransferase family 39 protein [Rhizobiaceae bacterium n13]|uniref:Glycosyltransferase family 39 protein n=1 Tax=Ferirhizobium litorale TaxID=2927786 RepID=A0AAE3QDR0_9HYPH|nr:glycosyltransferase family 39 protein [Fererhizobium litorale]MDI7861216.1 glycosyltransferase family 39 protein [Fererhizobium litorale]MDI7921363.1 glycosyltransferase family 39 protein [Fererhizobium litorale]
MKKVPETVLVLLAGYFLLNIVVRLAMPTSLELDEAQQALLSQWLAAGYDPQPPFYNWVQYYVVALLGPSVFALSLLKNALLFLSYAAYFLAARTVLKNRDLAIIATLGLLTIPQIAFEAQRDLSHTVAVIFAATLFLYGFFRTLAAPTAFSYLLTGAAIGIGMISKYNFALLPAAALIAILPDREMRSRLLDWRILLTAAVALVIVAPHALWLVDHLDLASKRTMEKLTEEGGSRLAQITTGVMSLLVAVIGFGALTVVLFAVAFGKQLFASLKAGNRWTVLIERIFLVFVAALVLLILFAGASHIKDRWLTPLLLILPLYLCLKIEAAGGIKETALRRFLPIPLAIMVLIPTVLAGRVVSAGWVGDYEKLNVPYQAFADEVVGKNPVQPAAIIAADQHLAGNLRSQLPGIPVLTPIYPDFRPSVEWSDKAPLLLVWRNFGKANAPMPPALAKEIARRDGAAVGALEVKEIALPYIYGSGQDTYSFAYAWVYPPQK